MSKAYIETTVLTNLLIKPGSSLCSVAQFALKRFDLTLLPVYSIKEWKAGPLDHYAYVHDKLLTTRSLAATIEAIHHLYRSPYKRSTSEEAIVAACRLDATVPWSRADYTSHDEENADRFRLALATLIKRSWRQRRRVATETIQDLDCYTEAEPKLDKKGLFDFKPKDCDPERECWLAAALKAAPHLLSQLRDAIPETSSREEDRRRRKVLKQLINRPKDMLTREQCRDLGDAIFAFFAPADSIILTTNLRDHGPLASAVSKVAQAP